ncbi:MAG TPA: hypothetical protein VG245_00970 [Candidatus Dormibacteraeota bacterium]|nr:hypothetical protein [Candidatus Dormibacteraeota bacterium]
MRLLQTQAGALGDAAAQLEFLLETALLPTAIRSSAATTSPSTARGPVRRLGHLQVAYRDGATLRLAVLNLYPLTLTVQ